MVIGFAGKARSGKDTAAKYICDTFNCLHYSFAKPIKESIKIMKDNISKDYIDSIIINEICLFDLTKLINNSSTN